MASQPGIGHSPSGIGVVDALSGAGATGLGSVAFKMSSTSCGNKSGKSKGERGDVVGVLVAMGFPGVNRSGNGNGARGEVVGVPVAIGFSGANRSGKGKGVEVNSHRRRVGNVNLDCPMHERYSRIVVVVNARLKRP